MLWLLSINFSECRFNPIQTVVLTFTSGNKYPSAAFNWDLSLLINFSIIPSDGQEKKWNFSVLRWEIFSKIYSFFIHNIGNKFSNSVKFTNHFLSWNVLKSLHKKWLINTDYSWSILLPQRIILINSTSSQQNCKL